MKEKRSINEILESIFFLIHEAKTLQIKDVNFKNSNIQKDSNPPTKVKNIQSFIPTEEQFKKAETPTLREKKKLNIQDKKKIANKSTLSSNDKSLKKGNKIPTKTKRKFKINKADAHNKKLHDWSKFNLSTFKYIPSNKTNNLYYIEKYIEENSKKIFGEEIINWIKKNYRNSQSNS